jgi:hypothetical protein
MEGLKEKVFLVSDKCCSCKKNDFCLCVRIKEEEIKLCLTCIFEYFNDYDAKDEMKGGKKVEEKN